MSSAQPTSYYQPNAERAGSVRRLFDRIASRYDFINDVQSGGLHRIWKNWLWALSQPAPGSRVLDLCCGTGDIAFLFAKHGCEVTGVDFSDEMLAVARSRPADELPPKTPAPTFRHGDALQLDFPDASFDVITVGYGLRNLADLERGLREITRVLKPGGKLMVLEFGKPANPVILAGYYLYLHLAVPVFGRIFCGDSRAYAYILESLRHYPGQRGVHTLLEKLGYGDNRIMNFMGGTMSINHATRPEAG